MGRWFAPEPTRNTLSNETYSLFNDIIGGFLTKRLGISTALELSSWGTLGGSRTHSSLHLTHHCSLALDFTRIADIDFPLSLL